MTNQDEYADQNFMAGVRLGLQEGVEQHAMMVLISDDDFRASAERFELLARFCRAEAQRLHDLADEKEEK